jgi:nitronate monooxygenase
VPRSFRRASVSRVLTALHAPIVLAPMAGGPTTPDLVAAVSAAGIVDGSGVAAVLAAGAVAAQLGTAFLACPEAGTKPAHRAALGDPDGPTTAITRAFTGRPARGIRNPFLDDHTAAAPAAYPQVHHMTRPIRAHGDPAAINLWAGQAYPLVRPLPAAELVVTLLEEAREAASRAAAGVAR